MKLKKTITLVLSPLLSSVKYQHLLFGFVGREIKGRFAGSMGGMLWTILTPLASIAVYTFIFSMVMRVQVTAEETGTDSFIIYFLTGFFPWLIFSDSLVRAAGSLVDNASLITKVVFPVELLPFSSVLTSLIINGVGLGIVCLIMALHGYAGTAWIFLPFIIFVQTFFTWGLANLFAGICVFIRDTREFLNILIMVWFFSTPIIYPMSMVPESLRPYLSLNPMALMIDAYRSVLLLNQIPIQTVIALLGLALLSYCIGAWFFMRAKPAFADVL
jgi:lipopolysaccharide transport system permease protein